MSNNLNAALLHMITNLFPDLGPDAADALTRLTKSTYDTWNERPDAEHWMALHPYIERLFRLHQMNREGEPIERISSEIDLDDLNEKAAWFIYMIDAFDRGERFIVAKLAFDGGAA